MTHQLAVSIINYKTAEMTLACVRSVLADIGDLDVQIVVVDNASGDGSNEVIAAWIAAQPAGVPVTLVRSTTNSGFSGGHNQGIAACEAAHYLVLNSDAIVQPGFLARMLQTAEAQPKAGLISPKIIDEDGTVAASRFRFHGPASELFRGANLTLIAKLLPKAVVAIPQQDPTPAQWVSFACVMLNGEMLRALGPMDQGYFMYFEDEEYCLRATRAGWSIALCPEAVVTHYEGGSGNVVDSIQTRKRVPKYYYSSRTRFLYQAHGQIGMLASNLLWHLGVGLSQVKRVFGKSASDTNTAEWRDIWTNAFNPLGPDHAPK